MNGLRAITVRPPWSLPILLGVKRVENRRQPTTHRGLTALHVSRTPCLTGARDPRVIAAQKRIPAELDRLHTAGHGAIVATFQLTDCHPVTGRCCRPWGDQPTTGMPIYHYVLSGVHPLRYPVPARGSYGVWTTSFETAVVVAADGLTAQQPAQTEPELCCARCNGPAAFVIESGRPFTTKYRAEAACTRCLPRARRWAAVLGDVRVSHARQLPLFEL